nr:hypothetical protein CFP56_62121 [Quercus suber]
MPIPPPSPKSAIPPIALLKNVVLKPLSRSLAGRQHYLTIAVHVPVTHSRPAPASSPQTLEPFSILPSVSHPSRRSFHPTAHVPRPPDSLERERASAPVLRWSHSSAAVSCYGAMWFKARFVHAMQH